MLVQIEPSYRIITSKYQVQNMSKKIRTVMMTIEQNHPSRYHVDLYLIVMGWWCAVIMIITETSWISRPSAQRHLRTFVSLTGYFRDNSAIFLKHKKNPLPTPLFLPKIYDSVGCMEQLVHSRPAQRFSNFYGFYI